MMGSDELRLEALKLAADLPGTKTPEEVVRRAQVLCDFVIGRSTEKGVYPGRVSKSEGEPLKEPSAADADNSKIVDYELPSMSTHAAYYYHGMTYAQASKEAEGLITRYGWYRAWPNLVALRQVMEMREYAERPKRQAA